MVEDLHLKARLTFILAALAGSNGQGSEYRVLHHSMLHCFYSIKDSYFSPSLQAMEKKALDL
jgi:hypothetical protein